LDLRRAFGTEKVVELVLRLALLPHALDQVDNVGAHVNTFFEHHKTPLQRNFQFWVPATIILEPFAERWYFLAVQQLAVLPLDVRLKPAYRLS
jgi:hypothetical protein